MSFAEIQRDQQLVNALSKALKAAQSDEQFCYLNDKKRDPTHLFETYVKNTSLPKFVNVSSAMIKSCTTAAGDPKKLAAEIAKVTAEVEQLFGQNLRPTFMASTSCETWCDLQNEEIAKVECAKRGKKLAKILGINVRMITEALTAIAMARFKKDENAVKKLLNDIKEEGDKAKAKELEKLILAELENMGLR